MSRATWTCRRCGRENDLQRLFCAWCAPQADIDDEEIEVIEERRERDDKDKDQ
jgi:hypothetical protein